MKAAHFYTATGLGALAAVLGLTLLILGSSARSLSADLQNTQAQFQAQQEQINTAVTIRQQVIPNLFADLSKFPDDVAIKALLAKHGYHPGPGK